VTERVVVEAVGDTVNTTSGEISTTITQAQVLDMALNQRHYESLIGLVPGAALQGSGTNPAGLDPRTTITASRLPTGSGWTGRTGA